MAKTVGNSQPAKFCQGLSFGFKHRFLDILILVRVTVKTGFRKTVPSPDRWNFIPLGQGTKRSRVKKHRFFPQRNP